MLCGFPAVGFGAVAPYESRTESESSRWFYLIKKRKKNICVTVKRLTSETQIVQVQHWRAEKGNSSFVDDSSFNFFITFI